SCPAQSGARPECWHPRPFWLSSSGIHGPENYLGAKNPSCFSRYMVRLKAFLERARGGRPACGEPTRATGLKNEHGEGFCSGVSRLRARMKRRETVRRLEIIAIVAVVAISLGVGFYLALNATSNGGSDGKPVPLNVYNALYQTSEAPYGASGSAYLKDVQSLTGQLFTTNGKPIL